MVFNKKDLSKAFSPNRLKRIGRRRLSGNGMPRPSTSGSTSGTTMRSENETNGSQTSIRVIVRVRPHNERELQANCRTVVKIVDDRMLIFDPKEEVNPFFYQGVAQKGRDLLKKQNKELQFMFDRIFDMPASNSDVFIGSTKELITSLLDGYNCSVFAYGATGAGKTHTMLGSPNDPGITYRTVAELFSQIDQQGEQRDFNLGVTYLEVYNENVQDLLHKSGPLHLRDNGRFGVIVADLKIISIRSAEELLTLLAKGNRNRTQHPTDANAESSRSHAVFQVYINMTNKLDGQVKQVKLSMIDLAGSERASATGSKGLRFKEGANINKSLLALGNCINNLADGAKHITYRDSKLTRLLKDSLGGNCQTVMIANVAPSSFSYEDTYNTLRYADRAKKIKTRIKRNIISCEMHVTTYIKMVEEQKKEIDYLKQRLLAFETGLVRSPVAKESKTSEEKSVEARSAEACSQAMTDRLISALRKKKVLNERVLSLESADKILCCRIQYKKAADERLRNLTATIDTLTPEEQNASGKSRVNKSVHYFQRQRDSLKKQMEAAWSELRSVESELLAVDTEIKSKGLESLYESATLQSCEIEKSRMQQQYEHARKVSNIQQCEMHSVYSIVRMMSTTLQNYYTMMRGYEMLTDKTRDEFKRLIKLLEGVRNIKWSDMGTIEQEEHFYSLTCLGLPQLMDPLNSQPPIYEPCRIVEETEPEVDRQKDALDTTFDATSIKTERSEDSQNTSIQDGANATTNKETLPEIPPVLERTTTTTAYVPEKIKKRVLSDKNQVNGRTPTKQLRKISPKHRGILQAIGNTGKENKHAQKPHHVTMSAKSVAILNKLRADRLKSLAKESFEADLSGNLTENLTGNGPPSTLKAVRDKERRGLSTTHPYQKPNGRQKFAPAPPSSRVPW